MTDLILASQSSRRKKLLKLLNMPFKVIPSSVDENIPLIEPKLYVQELAKQKAMEVSKLNLGSLVVGADTIVVLNNEILGKPTDHKNAVEILSKLSGQEHSVFTGIAFIIHSKEGMLEKVKTFYEETKVTFAPLSQHEIESYVNSGSPMDKAGAYGIQDDWGTVFVKSIHGDYNNVVGLPLYRFYNEMKSFMPSILDVKNAERETS